MSERIDNSTSYQYLIYDFDNSCRSPWTCPYDNVVFVNTIVWGVVGPTKVVGARYTVSGARRVGFRGLGIRRFQTQLLDNHASFLFGGM